MQVGRYQRSPQVVPSTNIHEYLGITGNTSSRLCRETEEAWGDMEHAGLMFLLRCTVSYWLSAKPESARNAMKCSVIISYQREFDISTARESWGSCESLHKDMRSSSMFANSCKSWRHASSLECFRSEPELRYLRTLEPGSGWDVAVCNSIPPLQGIGVLPLGMMSNLRT
jgi:hypothetical protein